MNDWRAVKKCTCTFQRASASLWPHLASATSLSAGNLAWRGAPSQVTHHTRPPPFRLCPLALAAPTPPPALCPRSALQTRHAVLWPTGPPRARITAIAPTACAHRPSACRAHHGRLMRYIAACSQLRPGAAVIDAGSPCWQRRSNQSSNHGSCACASRDPPGVLCAASKRIDALGTFASRCFRLHRRTSQVNSHVSLLLYQVANFVFCQRARAVIPPLRSSQAKLSDGALLFLNLGCAAARRRYVQKGYPSC